MRPLSTIPHKYLTEQEAANYVKKCKRSLQKYRKEGRGPKFIKIGASVRYSIDHLDAWMDSLTKTSTSCG